MVDGETAMNWTEQQKAEFARAKDLYLSAAENWFRGVRADLQSIFAWQDAYIDAHKRLEANVEELERFVRQAHFIDEQVTAQGGVGAVQHTYTEKQNFIFDKWKAVYTRYATDRLRHEFVPELESVFRWSDAFIELWKQRTAHPHELPRFAANAALIFSEYQKYMDPPEAYAPQVEGVQNVDGVPFFPGFDATPEQETRFQAAAAMYQKLQHVVGLQPHLWTNHEWIKSYIRDWRWKRAHPYLIGQLEAEVARVRTAWLKENKEYVVGQKVEWFVPAPMNIWAPGEVRSISIGNGQAVYGVKHDDVVIQNERGYQKVPAGNVQVESAFIRVPKPKTDDVAGIDESDESDDIGWWPGFGPSDESKKTFELASARLDELLVWNVAAKLPHRKATIESVTKYRAEFVKGDADLAHLGGYKNDIESLAKEAAEKGFVIKGGALPSVDVESVAAANVAAAAAEQARKDAAKALIETGQGVGVGLGKVFEAIPTNVKIAVGAGVLGLGAIAAAAFGKEKGRR
jgi:hypothetical protein